MKIGVICFTARGCRTALELREVLTGPEEGDPQENQIRVWCKRRIYPSEGNRESGRLSAGMDRPSSLKEMKP